MPSGCRRMEGRKAGRHYTARSATTALDLAECTTLPLVTEALAAESAELYARNLRFVEEEIRIRDDLRPTLATTNQVRLDLRSMLLRDYGRPGKIPTLVDAPHAGHTRRHSRLSQGTEPD